MKIKHLKRYLIGIAMTAFLALLAGNAFGNAAADTNASRDFSDGDGNYANNFMVMSPYWQVEGGVSYTFVAVSHSSLSGMASQIGVVFNAITSDKTAYDTAQSFTVSAGETKRVFIISTNHGTINRASLPEAVFLAGTTNFAYGHIRVNAKTTHPMLKHNTTVIKANNHGDGFRDPTMLTYWGSVIIEASTTGFAMEFIGDLNDSQTLAVDHGTLIGTLNANVNHMGSGPNLN